MAKLKFLIFIIFFSHIYLYSYIIQKRENERWFIISKSLHFQTIFQSSNTNFFLEVSLGS